MKYWLIKSEPDVFSIDDLRRDGATAWEGVRNYQARNNLRAMEKGDLAIFYHSSTDPAGAVGIAKVVAHAHADASQFDVKSEYYDKKATRDAPIWDCPDVAFIEKFKRIVTLAELKSDPKLHGIAVAVPGSRLSVQPLSKEHFERIHTLGSTGLV
jgi:predicted RNA-binding protein with PUA-like domain